MVMIAVLHALMAAYHRYGLFDTEIVLTKVHHVQTIPVSIWNRCGSWKLL